MPVGLNQPAKLFGVRFIKKDEHMVERVVLEALGRSDASDQVLQMYPGAEILETWQDGSFRVR